MKQTTDFLAMKENKEKIVMVTAYDYSQAKLVEQAGVDVILVGDSLGMVVLGYDSTVPVTVDDMVHHTRAVKRGARDTMVITDLPFMSYQISDEEAMKQAREIMQKGGAHAVKLEGADGLIPLITKLTNSGVPVCGHLGLTPQMAGVLGGYKVQAKEAQAAHKLIEDAKKIEKSGAFMLVLECVPKQVAEQVADQLTIPVIGIGAGVDVDGQVLVFHDLLTFGVDRVPKFVKKFANINHEAQKGLLDFIQEVKSKQFPTDDYSFTMKHEELQRVTGGK